MAEQTLFFPSPVIPPEVAAFASERGVGRYLPGAINLAQQAFRSSALVVSLGEDAEDETHRYIALDIEVCGLRTEELLAAQQAWSAGISQLCPSPHAVYFVLGWR
jgi:hypothetical protein